jgi:hypothetical protein
MIPVRTWLLVLQVQALKKSKGIGMCIQAQHIAQNSSLMGILGAWELESMW